MDQVTTTKAVYTILQKMLSLHKCPRPHGNEVYLEGHFAGGWYTVHFDYTAAMIHVYGANKTSFELLDPECWSKIYFALTGNVYHTQRDHRMHTVVASEN